MSSFLGRQNLVLLFSVRNHRDSGVLKLGHQRKNWNVSPIDDEENRPDKSIICHRLCIFSVRFVSISLFDFLLIGK